MGDRLRRVAPTRAVGLGLLALGVLLAARRPANPIGWPHHAFQPAHVSIWSASGHGTR